MPGSDRGAAGRHAGVRSRPTGKRVSQIRPACVHTRKRTLRRPARPRTLTQRKKDRDGATNLSAGRAFERPSPELLAVAMPKKTQMSRFPIHDDLTAPEE